jgi:hypothetical protein
MKMLIRSIICAVLSAALAVSLLPAQANVMPPAKSDCCAKMQMGDQHNDCGKNAPKSQQDQQCCAACFVCVAIVPAPTVIPKRAEGKQQFATVSESVMGRMQRPPVPPPRDALA